MININPQDFNIIEMGQALVSNIAEIVGEYLGVMTVKAPNYYPSTIVAGTVYTLDLSVTDENTGTPSVAPITYTALAGDTTDTIINSIVTFINTTYSTQLYAKAHVDYSDPSDMYFTVVGKDSISVVETAKSNLASDPTEVYAETDIPAVYHAYDLTPTATYPRIVVFSNGSNNTTCPRYGNGTIDYGNDVYKPFSASYVKYTMGITCESGNYKDVLQGKHKSAETILSNLNKRLTNSDRRRVVQESMNSTFTLTNTITPSPVVEATEYMDIAGTRINFDTVDLYIDDLGGVIEAMHIKTAVYKYNAEGAIVLQHDNITIDRRNI